MKSVSGESADILYAEPLGMIYQKLHYERSRAIPESDVQSQTILQKKLEHYKCHYHLIHAPSDRTSCNSLVLVV